MEEMKVENQNKQNPQQPNKKSAAGGIVAFIIVIALFVVIISSVDCSNSYLTYENYMKIHNGMSYSEVVNVLDGHQGELDSTSGYGGYTLSFYTWSNRSKTRCIVIGFENGIVCAKSQYGLG